MQVFIESLSNIYYRGKSSRRQAGRRAGSRDSTVPPPFTCGRIGMNSDNAFLHHAGVPGPIKSSSHRSTHPSSHLPISSHPAIINPRRPLTPPPGRLGTNQSVRSLQTRTPSKYATRKGYQLGRYTNKYRSLYKTNEYRTPLDDTQPPSSPVQSSPPGRLLFGPTRVGFSNFGDHQTHSTSTHSVLTSSVPIKTKPSITHHSIMHANPNPSISSPRSPLAPPRAFLAHRSLPHLFRVHIGTSEIT